MDDIDIYLRLAELFKESSKTMTTWALSIIGGWATVTLLSSDKMRPPRRKWRLIYLFFMLGCVCSVISIVFANLISRDFIALHMPVAIRDVELIKEIVRDAMNTNYGWQLYSLMGAVACLGVWLILFTIWWIFCQKK